MTAPSGGVDITGEVCLGPVCLVPLDADSPTLFGFPEFLAGLALMVLAWTIGDVRYRFRVRTAPLPLQVVTYAVVAAVGTFTLLTDLWLAEEWLVPRGSLLTPASWQALLGAVLLITFLTWAWFAFIRPPVFRKRNASRYAQTLYRAILRGSDSELAVVADELGRSARSLVQHATDSNRFDRGKLGDSDQEDAEEREIVSGYADDLLLLMADKRLCRAIVESAPGTALALFRAMNETEKYGIQVRTFCRNLVSEAFANKDSFLFHETEGYESGLIGYHRPLSREIFSNYRLVERVGSLLDPRFRQRTEWDSDQWAAYCRVVLMTLRDYAERGLWWQHSPVLYTSLENMKRAVSDLYELNEKPNTSWDEDVLGRLRVIVDFINNAVDVLDEVGVPNNLQKRVHRRPGPEETIYDRLSDLIAEVIFHASAVTAPTSLCWWVQHNSVWAELFGPTGLDGEAGGVVKFKVRRLLYNEIARMESFPNFKGAKILGFCLNVMGLELREDDRRQDSKALHKAMLSWTRKHYAWLHDYNPRVAEACLVEGIEYEVDEQKLVKTYPAEGLRREPRSVELSLNPPPADADNEVGRDDPPQEASPRG